MAIVGALPIQLANGTLADATQVMSDFNYIVSQVNANAAQLAGGNAFTGAQTIAGDTIITASASQAISNKTFSAVSFAAGSAPAPSVTNATGNTGAYWPTTTTFGIATAGVNAITVDASQRVGIGGVPVSYPLELVGSTALMALRPSTTTNQAFVQFTNGGGDSFVGVDSSTGGFFGFAYSMVLQAATGRSMVFLTGGGAQRMSITSAGLVTVAGGGLAVTGGTTTDTLTATGLMRLTGGVQPAVNAQRITSNQALGNGSITDAIFNSANTDQASNFNTTTGIFTAPVSGVYSFSAYVLLGNTTASPNVYNGIFFSKNNATSGAGSRFDITFPATYSINNGQFASYTAAVVLKLVANDTVRVKVDDTTGGVGTVNMTVGSWFCAYLLG